MIKFFIFRLIKLWKIYFKLLVIEYIWVYYNEFNSVIL